MFQRQNIRAFLMHPRKVQAREIDEGIVAGENDLFPEDGGVWRLDPVVVNAKDRSVLVNSQRLCNALEKLQRLKLRLMSKADCPGRGNGQCRLPYEGGGSPSDAAASASA